LLHDFYFPKRRAFPFTEYFCIRVFFPGTTMLSLTEVRSLRPFFCPEPPRLSLCPETIQIFVIIASSVILYYGHFGLLYSSVSQPVVRGPPVVRDDGRGGPQVSSNKQTKNK
jgi:hypothetical protein